MKKCAYYDDSYIRTATIPENETLPQVKFTYKPLNMVQAAVLTDAIIKNNSVANIAKLSRELICKHVVDWDLYKMDGSKVELIPEELEKIDPILANKIAANIRGDRNDFEDINRMTNEEKFQEEQDQIKNL